MWKIIKIIFAEYCSKNSFKVQHVNKLNLDIALNKKPERKFDWQKYKLYTIQYFSSFFEKLKYNLKRFYICLVAKPPPELKNIICAKIDTINFEN